MARTPTTSDVFNAVAEAQRRKILELLTQGEHSVNQIAEALNIRQPQTSKHLAVLKEVGLVTMRSDAQQRLYKLNPEGIKEIFEWAKTFERHWNESLDKLEAYLEQLQEDNSNERTPHES
jgi:DNA-binding transcriptional ArsR family regulator